MQVQPSDVGLGLNMGQNLLNSNKVLNLGNSLVRCEVGQNLLNINNDLNLGDPLLIYEMGQTCKQFV